MRDSKDAKFPRPFREIRAWISSWLRVAFLLVCFCLFGFLFVLFVFYSCANFDWKWVWHSSPHFPSRLFSVEKKGMTGMDKRETVKEFRQSPHIHDQSLAEHKDVFYSPARGNALLKIWIMSFTQTNVSLSLSHISFFHSCRPSSRIWSFLWITALGCAVTIAKSNEITHEFRRKNGIYGMAIWRNSHLWKCSFCLRYRIAAYRVSRANFASELRGRNLHVWNCSIHR